MSATPGLQLCANHRLLQREAALMRVERRTNAVSEWVIRSWFGTVSVSRETAVSPPPRAYGLPVTWLATGTWSNNSAKYSFQLVQGGGEG